jgi:hypothetical protein
MQSMPSGPNSTLQIELSGRCLGNCHKSLKAAGSGDIGIADDL